MNPAPEREIMARCKQQFVEERREHELISWDRVVLCELVGSDGRSSMPDIYIRGNHWRKAQRRLPERRDPPPEPPRRERGTRTFASLLVAKRRKPRWK